MRGRGVRALAAAAVCALLAGGIGCSRSPQDQLRRSAERGEPRAQFNLGMMYAKGQGVPQDYAKAVDWWRKAAGQGDLRSQFNLGVFYAKGEGVSQDYREAEKWWRLAADQGDANAQFNLGILYAGGQGVPADPVQAYKWYSVAASNLNSPSREAASKNRQELAATMSPAQIAEAQGLAAVWKPTKGKR